MTDDIVNAVQRLGRAFRAAGLAEPVSITLADREQGMRLMHTVSRDVAMTASESTLRGERQNEATIAGIKILWP